MFLWICPDNFRECRSKGSWLSEYICYKTTKSVKLSLNEIQPLSAVIPVTNRQSRISHTLYWIIRTVEADADFLQILLKQLPIIKN